MMHRVALTTAVVALLSLGRTATVAQNLLTNPGFDGDLSGWTLVEPAEFDPDLDATGSPGSGSARWSSGVTGTDTIVLSQCLPAVAGASYTFGVKIFHETPTPAGVELFFFSTTDCTATVLGVEGPLHAALTPGAWSPVDSAPVVAPPGALGMLIAGVRTHFNPDALATTSWDDFYVLEEGGEPVPGSITVVKETNGGDGTFAFTSDLPDNASFSITTSGGSGQHGPITVTELGPYSIAETVPDGWSLTSATCDNGDDPSEVTVGREESVTCTFVNEAAEPVPALPWVGAIALMLSLATSATWAQRRARSTRAIWIAMVGLAAASAAEAEVSGHFRFGEARVDIQHGCAYRIPGYDPGVERKLVFLADRPLDCAVAEAALAPDDVLDDAVEEAGGGHVRIWVGPDGTEQGLYFSSSEPSESFNFSGSGEWELSADTERRIEGSWRTAAPDEFFDQTYEFDLRWALEVSAGPVRGEPLPAGGGEPGAALDELVRAVVADNHAVVKSRLTAEKREEVFLAEGTDWFPEGWKYWKLEQLADVEVLHGLLDGDRATLYVRGKKGNGDPVRGPVRMVRSDGAWRFHGWTYTITTD